MILTPSRLVREQISEKFATLDDLDRVGALPPRMARPKVKTLKGRIGSDEEWAALGKYDVVVGTVNSVSGIKQPVPEVPAGLFDLVIADEGHHSPAATWSRVLSRLEGTRQVLLTATPFRRDSKDIPGRIAFVYDVRRALEDRVFGDLAFVEARPGPGESSDEAIARAAERQFEEDRGKGLRHLVMVRVDSIARGRELDRLYREKTKLRLRFVSGASALSTVKKTVQNLRDDELDGIVCVNMFGEGFDLPRLKIAALHSPHKSLAVTLQFIGRFARTNDPQIGQATFIAYPLEQKNELQDLWTSGAPWPEFVHNINATRTQAEAATRKVLESFHIEASPDLRSLSLASFRPYYHAKVYHCPDGVNLDAEIGHGHDETLVFSGRSEPHGAVVRITQGLSKPRWTKDYRIQDLVHDLDILYFNSKYKLLFICSSRKLPEHYRIISSYLTDDRILTLSSAAINRALNDIEGIQIFSLGMRKRQFGGRSESYRTLAGPSADRSVDTVAAQSYDRGHSFGKGRCEDTDVTIGISTSSKAWSNTVGTIPSLIGWFDTLAERIGSGISKPTGCNIDLLSTGINIDRIDDEIVCGIFSQKTYHDPPMVFVDTGAGAAERGILAEYDIEVIDQDESGVHFRVTNSKYGWDGLYAPGATPLIAPFDAGEEEPRVGGRHGDMPISTYLSDYPPRFFTATMSAIEGSSLFAPPEFSAKLEPDDFDTYDWPTQGVDIELEKPADIEIKGMSIFAWLERSLTQPPVEFVFCDDGPGEIADFITLQDSKGDPFITFYHCKASGGKAGSRAADLYDVCGQAVRSGIWIAGSRLLDRIDYRIKTRGTGGIRKGAVDHLRTAFGPRQRQRVKFKLVIVQPGASAAQLREGPHQLLVAAKNYATAANFDEFKIIASA